MIGGVILSRLNSAYHHEMLFIWQSDPFGGHNDNKKAYRGKMTILGLSYKKNIDEY